MATSYKVLGQTALTDATEATVYTVPAATQAIISTAVFANRSFSNASIRLAVRPSADNTTIDKHYIVYDTEITGNTSGFFTLGITLNAGDKIMAYAAGDAVSVNVFGSEIS